MSAPEIPGFTHLSHLGTGGYSDVHLYEQHRPRRQVAIKVIRDAMDPRQQARFAAEADTMASLADHPYIVPVLAADITADGRPYLVMRYFPPPDLGARVKQQPLTVPEALRTGIQIASAVETAHRAGILHRDIKPANILISSYHTPALTDFGIAGTVHEVDADDDVGVSIPWTAPEVLAGASNGSVASDVYALGATIWNLLTGRSPFRAEGSGANSSVAMMTRIHQQPAPPTGVDGVPSALDRLLQQCLAKDPAHRPRSALELARGLAAIEQDARFSRTDIVVPESFSETATPPSDDAPGTRRRPLAPEPRAVDATPATARRPARPDDASTRRRAAPPEPGGSAVPAASADAPDHVTHQRRWWLLVAGAVTLAAAGIVALLLSGGKEPRSPTALPTYSATPDFPGESGGIAINPPHRQGHRVVFTLERIGTLDPDTVVRWAAGDEEHGLASEGRPVVDDRIVVPLLDGQPTCITVSTYPAGQSSPSDTRSRCLE